MLFDHHDCIVPAAPKRNKGTFSRGDSKCWYCRNACGGCSWSAETAEPVEGWDAVRVDLIYNHVTKTGVKKRVKMESYVVIDCPGFSLDPRFARDFQRWSPRKALSQARKKRREQR